MSLENIKSGYQRVKKMGEIGAQQLYLLEWWEHARQQFELSKFELDITLRRLKYNLTLQNLVTDKFAFEAYGQAASVYVKELQGISDEFKQLNAQISDSDQLIDLVNTEIERVDMYRAIYKSNPLAA